MHRQWSRILNTYRTFARVLLISLLLVAAVIGAFIHASYLHISIVRSRTRDAAQFKSFLSRKIPQLPIPSSKQLTLISTSFPGYSNARQSELSLVRTRNSNLNIFNRYIVICEAPCSSRLSKQLHESNKMTVIEAKNRTGPITYETLFQYANKLSGTVIVAHADIYFDASILCSRLLRNNSILALSRHPSPDCAAASGHGDTSNEPADLCANYHRKKSASHDAFIFTPPIPSSVLKDVENLAVNTFGAENVVVGACQRAGWNVINPCSRIHAFHQHCTMERAASAHQRAGSEATRRRLFGGAAQSGWVHGREWMDVQMVEEYGEVDCLNLGLMTVSKHPTIFNIDN